MEIAPFSSRLKLYDQVELLEIPDKFVIKPVDLHHQGFSVDHGGGNIKPLDGVMEPPENCGGYGCDEATFKTVEKIYPTINQFFRM